MLEDISNWVTVVSWIVTLFEVVGAVIIFYASARVVVELVRPALHRHPPTTPPSEWTTRRKSF